MNPNKLAQVFHFDLYGKREAKYDFLNQNSLKSIEWNNLQPEAPNFFLVKKDFDQSGDYKLGFKIDELFEINACGIVSARDSLLIKFSQNEVQKLKYDFMNLGEKEFRSKYNERKDSRDWSYFNAKKESEISTISRIDYRPFDKRLILYSAKSKGIISYPRNEIMKHMLQNNLSLITCRQQSTFDFQHIFISDCITEGNSISMQTKERSYVFPLYFYPEPTNDLFAKTERTPNLNQAIIDKLAEGLGIPFVAEKTHNSSLITHNSFAPIDVLDYIYAVLHSPVYREKYKEFLKIDFPRVPFPRDLKTFEKLSNLGSQIRQIHLLESPVVEEYITQYPEDGDNVVVKISFAPLSTGEGSGRPTLRVRLGRVYINENQYFDNVPETAWNFYIGGYQPAQKWLKDRKERELSFEDILHYQKIIVALTETARIMGEIDLVGVE